VLKLSLKMTERFGKMNLRGSNDSTERYDIPVIRFIAHNVTYDLSFLWTHLERLNTVENSTNVICGSAFYHIENHHIEKCINADLVMWMANCDIKDLTKKDKKKWEEMTTCVKISDTYIQTLCDSTSSRNIRDLMKEIPFSKFRRNGKLIYKKTIRIDIRDSLKMIPMPLSDFSKAFKLTACKEVMPYGVYTKDFIARGGQATHEQLLASPFFEDFDELFHNLEMWECNNPDGTYDMLKYSEIYCKQDVKVLAEGYGVFRDSLLEDVTYDMDCSNFVTIPSMADAYLIEQGCYAGVHELSGVPQMFIAQATVGGRTMVKDNTPIHTEKDLSDIDASSLYASAMVRMDGFPKLKNKAFIANEINKGSSFSDIADKVGYKSGSVEYVSLKSDFKTIKSTPKEIQPLLEKAGFVPKTKAGIVGESVAKFGGKLTSTVGETAVKVVNIQTGAGVLGGVGTVAALSAAGVDDPEILAASSGAVANVSSDGAAATVRAITRGGQGAVVGEELIMSDAILMGAEVGASSLAKGGVAGILGYGVERAVLAAGDGLGVSGSVTSVAAAGAGGAASGAIFGPEGAILGAALGAGVEGASEIWQSYQPQNDFMLQPFRHPEIDRLIGADPEILKIVSEFNEKAVFDDNSIRRTEQQVTNRVIIMQKAAGWTHGYDKYSAALTATSRGSQNSSRNVQNQNTVMLGGDYSSIQTTERKHAEQQWAHYKQYATVRKPTKTLKSYISKHSLDEFLEDSVGQIRQHERKIGSSMFLSDTLKTDVIYSQASTYAEANERIKQIIGSAPEEYRNAIRSNLLQFNADGIIDLKPTMPDSVEVSSISRISIPENHETIHAVMAA
jgi:hypothetical protein